MAPEENEKLFVLRYGDFSTELDDYYETKELISIEPAGLIDQSLIIEND